MIKLETKDLEQIAEDIKKGCQDGTVQDKKVHWCLDLWEEEQ